MSCGFREEPQMEALNVPSACVSFGQIKEQDYRRIDTIVDDRALKHPFQSGLVICDPAACYIVWQCRASSQ